MTLLIERVYRREAKPPRRRFRRAARRALLLSVGACATFGAALGQHPPKSSAPESVERLVVLMEQLTEAPLYRDNAVRLLLDGPETHGAMLAAIAAAEHDVHLETYIFAADEIGERFAAALAAAAERGVNVRVIYDSVGSRSAPAEFFDELRARGVAAREYNPIRSLEMRDKDTRNHRKLLIVDGRVAFTGGINIDRNYALPSRLTSSGEGPTGWRDTHVEVRGPAVQAFQQLFVTLWEGLDGPLSGPPFQPPEAHAPAGKALVRVLAGVGGNDEVSTIRLAFEAAARSAAERLWITQSYFVPDDPLTEAIATAAASGVDVRILLAGESDSALVVAASQSFYGDLLEHGVEIYESREHILHAKTMVVDGAWSTIGSSNIDYLSFLHNHEANAVIVDAEFGASLERVFEADLANAERIELQAWRRRSPWQRAKELYSRLMRYRL